MKKHHLQDYMRHWNDPAKLQAEFGIYSCKHPTFEGVVIRGINNIRFKVKNKLYLSLHHMKDNGACTSVKRMLPWVLKGETAELLTYFPEFKEQVNQLEVKVSALWETVYDAYKQSQGIENQKEFALKIQKLTKLTGILFALRQQQGIIYPEVELRKAWMNSEDLILKVMDKGA